MKTVRMIVAVAAVVALAFGGAPGASGGFVLVDNFESYTLGDISGQSDGSGTWTASASFDVAAGPVNPANQALNLTSGGGDAFNDDASLTVPEGSIATLFFRYYVVDATPHCAVGLSDLAAPGGSFNDYEVLFRSQDNDLDARDGGTYRELEGSLPTGEWFNVWVLTNNADDHSTVFIQSSTTFPTQKQLDASGPDVIFNYRNGTAASLQTLYLRNVAGDHDGPWYLDDVHMQADAYSLLAPGVHRAKFVRNQRVVEDFQDGVANGFTPVDGNGGSSSSDGVWAVVNESGNFVYSQTNSGLANDGSKLGAYSLAAPTVESFELSVDVRIDDTNAAADAALVFGWQDNDNYYDVIFNATAASNEVHKIVGGIRTQIGPDFAPLSIADGSFHTVELLRRIETGLGVLKIDGVEVLTFLDMTFGAGRVGVGAYNDAASFDNFELVEFGIPEPGTLSLLALGGLGLLRRRRRRRA